MRKTKPIEEIQNLTPTQLAQLHTWFEDGVTYKDCMAKFQSEFGTRIKYHKIYKYFHIWQHATELYKHSGQKVALLEIIAVLQGEAAPFSELTHHLIQKAACSMAANPDNTAMDLYRLMRLANNPLQQDYLRHRTHVQDEKLALQKRALELRAEQQKNRAESPKTSQSEAIKKSNAFRKYCENHPVLKGIVAEPKSYEETAKENDYLYRTGTNTSPYRVVGPIDSNLNRNLNHPNRNPAPAANSASPQSTHCPSPIAHSAPTPVHSHSDPESKSNKPDNCLLITDRSSPACPLCASAQPHLDPQNLAAASDRYTIRRAKEYWAHRRLEDAWYEEQARRPHLRGSPPQYNTELRECPCGSALPCPHHEPFLERFWKCSPHDVFYAQSLQDRAIPYRNPTEFCA